jgi:hypothetical protein
MLMRKGAGSPVQSHSSPIGNALDRFIGSWTDDEENQILQSIVWCEEIDESLWS